MSSNLKKAGSNQRRSIVPMVVSLASGSVSWRFFVIDPVSNRINNRRAAPAGSYYPIAGEKINPVSESKKIRPVLINQSVSESIVIEEKIKPWYHFSTSGGTILKQRGKNKNKANYMLLLSSLSRLKVITIGICKVCKVCNFAKYKLDLKDIET